jgi:hypothetical protein
MRRLRATLALLITAALPMLARAQPVGEEFQINTYTTSPQTVPRIASDASGNFVVVWQKGFVSNVHGQRFDSAGAPLGGEFVVNTYTFYDQRLPSVAAARAT